MTPHWLRALAGVAFESSLRTTALAVLVFFFLFVFRVRSSALRHAAWTAVLGAMVFMPVMQRWMPPVPIWPAAAASGAVVPAIEAQPPDSFLPATPNSTATALPPSESPNPLPPITPRFPILPVVAVIVYCVGVALAMSRLFLGWRAMRKVLRNSAVVTGLSIPDVVLETDVIASPVTAGVMAPRVLLPFSWRTWPESQLRAVLAHEHAHIARRDPAIHFLARVNRSVFWFHPLAWWLERELALTAEHACDAAGVRTIGAARPYAEMLVAMAAGVTRKGRRLSVQAVGVNGGGFLDRRIDRVMKGAGDLIGDASTIQKIAVALTGAVTIFVVAACQRSAMPPPLTVDPAQAADVARGRARNEHQAAENALIVSVTPQIIADLEAKVAANPEDLESRAFLLALYTRSGRVLQIVGRNTLVERRRTHIVWFIAHHPDAAVRRIEDWQLSADTHNRFMDPVGYDEGKKLWLAQTQKPGASADVLGRAAEFLADDDPELAEPLFVKAHELQPNDLVWTAQLARLYAMAIVGGRYFVSSLADGPFAAHARKVLMDSGDPKLLASAAGAVAALPQRLITSPNVDTAAFSQQLIDRALKLDPDSVAAHRARVTSQRMAVVRRRVDLLVGVRSGTEAEYVKVASLPDADRLPLSIDRASNAYQRGNAAQYAKDAEGTKAAWSLARRYANDALVIAAKSPNNADSAAAIYNANILLGLLSFREGDRRGAVQHMLAASTAGQSEEISYFGSGQADILIAYLLEYGERESVIQFLERTAEAQPPNTAALMAAAADIRANRLPRQYQGIVQRGK